MKIKYTDEQLAIVKAGLDGKNLVVEANSGCAKTSSLFLYLQYAKKHRPKKKHLMLAFNTHLITEYEDNIKEFGLHKQVATTNLHKLAKRNTIDTKTVYLMNNEAIEVKKRLSITNIHGYDLLKYAPKGHNYNSWTIYQAFREFNTSNDNWTTFMSEIYRKIITRGLVSHDMYVKLFHLGLLNNNISLVDTYDCIILDESQDASSVLVDCFINSGVKQKIAVMDQRQRLYMFITSSFNAVTELSSRLDTKRLRLSKSFRTDDRIIQMVARELMVPYMDLEYKYEGVENKTTDDIGTMYLTQTNNKVLLKAFELARAGIKYKLTSKFTEITKRLREAGMLMSNAQTLELQSMKNLAAVDSILLSIEERLAEKNIKVFLVDGLSKDIKKDLVGFFYERKKREIALLDYMSKYGTSQLSGEINLIKTLAKKKLPIGKFLEVIKANIDKDANVLLSNTHKVKG